MSERKVIIVTGATRGIGRAICETLLKEDENVRVLATGRSREPLEDLESKHKERVEIYVVKMEDIPDADENLVHHALEKWGRLDGLIINHGTVDPVERLGETKVDEWKRAFDVNCFSAVAMLSAAVAPLRKTKGIVIFTSSGASVKGMATWGAYCASKAVLNSLARSVAVEEPDITALAIRPGVVDTQMQDTLRSEHFSKMEEADVERFTKLREDGAMLRPEQPGNVMARLALKKPSGLSGEFLNWNEEKLKDYQDH